MGQRSIAIYLSLKGLSAMEIHNNLAESLGSEPVAYSTITLYLCMTSFSDPIEVKEINIDRVHTLKSMGQFKGFC
jgi:hypothetical protein